MDGAVATRNVAALRGHRAALAEAQRAFSSAPVLVAEARAQAVTRGDAVRAAQLAVTEAALRDHEDGAAERWHAALEAALAAEQVRLAAAAASRIELAAIAGGALAPLIETAPKPAELGDVDTELGAHSATRRSRGSRCPAERSARRSCSSARISSQVTMHFA